MAIAERQPRNVTRLFQSRRNLRSGIEALRPVEKSSNLNVLSVQERADGAQALFMESYWLNEQAGRYESLLGANKHELGNLPESSHIILAAGRGVLYISYHDQDNTSFLWGNNRVRPRRAFLAINYVSPVDKKSQQVERFIIRVDDMSKAQAQQVIGQIFSEEQAQARDEGEGIISFAGDFDPLEKKSFFAESIKNVIGEGNLTFGQQRVIGQLDRQCQARMNTHDATKDYFGMELKFVDGKLIVKDSVLDQWVFLEDTTTDPKLLAFVLYNQKLIAKYLANPGVYGKELKIHFGVMLSARTAGFRNVPSAAISEITVDQAGNIKQGTDILPADTVNQLLFDSPQSNIDFAQRQSSSPKLSYIEHSPYGLSDGSNFSNRSIDTPFSNVKPAELTPDQRITLIPALGSLSFVMAAPAVAGYLSFSSTTTMTEGVFSERGLVESEVVDIVSEVPIPETYIFQEEINFESELELTDIAMEENPTPELPPDDPVPDGGRVLPQEFRTDWTAMKKKFTEIAPRFIQDDKDTIVAEDVSGEVREGISRNKKFNSTKEKRKEPEEFVVFASRMEVFGVDPETTVKPFLLAAKDLLKEEVFVSEGLNSVKSVKEETEVEANFPEKVEENTTETEVTGEVVVQEKNIQFLQESKTELKNIFSEATLEKPTLTLSREISQIFLALHQEPQKMPDWLKEIFLSIAGQDRDLPEKLEKADDKTYVERVEGNQHQSQKQNKLKLKTKINLAFLSLLVLTRLSLLRNLTSKINLQKLLLTDTFLLFLIKPDLFLVKSRI